MPGWELKKVRKELDYKPQLKGRLTNGCNAKVSSALNPGCGTALLKLTSPPRKSQASASIDRAGQVNKSSAAVMASSNTNRSLSHRFSGWKLRSQGEGRWLAQCLSRSSFNGSWMGTPTRMREKSVKGVIEAQEDRRIRRARTREIHRDRKASQQDASGHESLYLRSPAVFKAKPVRKIVMARPVKAVMDAVA